jgi:septal ring factor EnvC (AmiA/AmiB activator)
MMLIYGLILAGVLGLFGGAWWTGHSAGDEARRKIDEPLIAKQGAELELVKSQNANLQGDLQKIRGDVDSCNSAVAQLKKDSDEAISQMEQIIRLSEERRRATQQAQARLDAAARAQRPSTPVAEDQDCRAVRVVLGEYSDRVREALGMTPPPGRLTITAPAPAAAPPVPKPTVGERVRSFFKGKEKGK